MSELLSLIRAGAKPVIGMVQLGALPGSSRYRGAGIADILAPAVAEAEVLASNGIDVLMVQNLGDVPTDLHATKAQVAWMTRVTAEIRQRFGKPVGLNLLENDAEAMFAVASAADADFVRIKIFVGAMLTPFGVESAQAHTAIRVRTSWNAEKVAIFADVHDRTGRSLVPGNFEDDLDYAVRLGTADGLVLTGKTSAQTYEFIATARRVVGSVPILVGGGVTETNLAEVNAVADGTIVSSSLKGGGTAFGSFDPERVRSFMAVARGETSTR
ncbi:MAG TPA: BtpA/SgcQ family protein [Kaistia sp.]|nr:BtpA/SgcQ family protein [Kaistia sp.]